MSAPSENETWIIEAGDVVIQKKSSEGIQSLSPIERLIYCLWVADYGMRNAGDLATSSDIYTEFQIEAVKLAGRLGLRITERTFALPIEDLQRAFLARFEEMCDEIRRLV